MGSAPIKLALTGHPDSQPLLHGDEVEEGEYHNLNESGWESSKYCRTSWVGKAHWGSVAITSAFITLAVAVSFWFGLGLSWHGKPPLEKTWLATGMPTTEGIGNQIRHLGSDLIHAHCLGWNLAFPSWDIPWDHAGYKPLELLGDSGPLAQPICVDMRDCEHVQATALKATQSDCGEIAALARSTFQHCGTVIQNCGGRTVGIGHNKVLSKIAVERLCGNIPIKKGRAALYVRWGDQKLPKWNATVTWTTPTLKHAEELVQRLVQLTNLTRLDLIMEGASLATIADFRYLSITTLIADSTIQEDICALASYEFLAYGTATIAGLTSLYKVDEKVILSATTWQDSDDRPLVIVESLYGIGDVLVK